MAVKYRYHSGLCFFLLNRELVIIFILVIVFCFFFFIFGQFFLLFSSYMFYNEPADPLHIYWVSNYHTTAIRLLPVSLKTDIQLFNTSYFKTTFVASFTGLYLLTLSFIFPIIFTHMLHHIALGLIFLMLMQYSQCLEHIL